MVNFFRLSMVLAIILGGSAAYAADGAAVFEKGCAMCHASGVAGAPKLGDADAWGERAKQGVDVLVSSALNGKGAMPPKGVCAGCSDDEVRSAVEYMLSQI